MKLAVIGSRTFDDYATMEFRLDQLQERKGKIELIISGGAGGADKLAEYYANKRGIPTQIFPALWDKYGKGAGFMRNQHIIDAADKVFIFWDGESKGTKHSMSLAVEQKKEIFAHMFEPKPKEE